MENKENFIFIDSDIFHHFSRFSQNNHKGIIDFLEENFKDKVVLPAQVKNEVIRNCYGNWRKERINKLENKIDNLQNTKKTIENQIRSYASDQKIDKIIERINDDIKEKQNKIEKLKKDIKLSDSIKKIFKISKKISTSRETELASFLRAKRGNPPFEKGETVGDCIIWEEILNFFANYNEFNLIFLATDSHWCSSIIKQKFNPFLKKEFKEKTKGKLFFIRGLSEIPDIGSKLKRKLRKEEKERLREELPEKLKKCNTFNRADEIMSFVMGELNLLDCITINRFLKAGLENNKYSSGYINQVLNASRSVEFYENLLNKAYELNCDFSQWKEFYLSLSESQQDQFNIIKESLEEHGVEFLETSKEPNVDDIPF